MIKQFYLILVAIGLLALTSCTNDSVEDLSDDSEEGAIQSEEEQKALSVVNEFCNPVMDGDSIVGYTPKIGKQLDESNPSVYSIECDSLADVHKIINSFFFPLLDDNTDNLLPVSDLKSFGKIIYSEGQNGTIAQIKIDMPLLPNVKKINFISKDDWPENDIPGSPYGVGDVVVNSDRTEAYICVRACSGGLPGLLIGRKKPEIHEVRLKWQKFVFHINYIKTDGVDALAHMYFNYPNKLCHALEIILEKLKIDIWCNTGSLVRCLYYTANNKDYYVKKYPDYSAWDLFLLKCKYLSQGSFICAEGYEYSHKWEKVFLHGKHEVSCGKYYVYSLNKKMKNGIPVFKEYKTISWDKTSIPEIYANDDFYSFTQQEFNEFDKRYQVVELADFED